MRISLICIEVASTSILSALHQMVDGSPTTQ